MPEKKLKKHDLRAHESAIGKQAYVAALVDRIEPELQQLIREMSERIGDLTTEPADAIAPLLHQAVTKLTDGMHAAARCSNSCSVCRDEHYRQVRIAEEDGPRGRPRNPMGPVGGFGSHWDPPGETRF